MRAARTRTTREPTIALINIVFLMLVFFLIAGSIAPPLDPRVTLARTTGLDGSAPPDAAVVLPDGRLTWRGAEVTVAAFADAAGPAPRLVPDRDLPAADLVAIARALRDAGAEEVWIVTERGLE
ncbi:biopolymer transporter ExbD [Rhodobacterales bacterium HKCCE2091]|nr:biopolymer transporter ExbD [Rhodobacterales bacterium HKCCE2091]